VNARLALAALLLAAPAFASAAQVVPPPKSSVWAERDGWSIAVRDPETTTDALRTYARQAPSVDALVAGLKLVYDDRLLSIDYAAHLISISDEHRMWPVPDRSFETVVPDFSELAAVSDASDETRALAEQPKGNVHAVPLANGTPYLVCDVEGAVTLSYWQPTNGRLRGTRTVPVAGALVVLVEESLEHNPEVAARDPRVGNTYTTETDANGRYRFRFDMKQYGWEPERATATDRLLVDPEAPNAIPYGWDNRRFVEHVISNGQEVNPVPHYRNINYTGPVSDEFPVVPYPQRQHETKVDCVLTPETLRPPVGQSKGPGPGAPGACFPNGCFPAP
jgi:hypothetical protein